MLSRGRILLSGVLLGAVFLVAGCREFEAIQPGCGNRVVEPSLGEDCDSSSEAPSESGKPTRRGESGEAFEGFCLSWSTP